MKRPLRLLAARGALLAALLLGGSAAQAQAYVTTDLTNWDLHESVTMYGGGTEFHIATGTDGWVSYRWLDSTDRQTVISANSCGDYSLYGSPHTYNAGVTLYRSLFQGFQGLCFVMRGRTASGAGSMYNKDGRVRR